MVNIVQLRRNVKLKKCDCMVPLVYGTLRLYYVCALMFIM